MGTDDIRQRLLDGTGIDFAAYQHEELVEAIDVTASILNAIRRATIWATAALGVAIAAIWFTWRGGGGVLAVIVLAVVALVGAGALGAGIWVRSLGRNLETQTRHLLQVAGQSAGRMHEDLLRADPPPTDRQLAEGLLLVTVVPALGSAVRRRVWVVGQPLAVLSERLLANVLGRATSKLDRASRSGAVVGDLAQRLQGVVLRVGAISEPVLERFRRWVIMPLTVGLLAVAVVAGGVFVTLAISLR